LRAPENGMPTNPSLGGAKSKHVLGRVSKCGAAMRRTSPQARTGRFVPRHVFATFRTDTAELPHFGHAECPNIACGLVGAVGCAWETSSHRRLKKSAVAAEVGWLRVFAAASSDAWLRTLGAPCRRRRLRSKVWPLRGTSPARCVGCVVWFRLGSLTRAG
jgi:hypothetical protein